MNHLLRYCIAIWIIGVAFLVFLQVYIVSNYPVKSRLKHVESPSRNMFMYYCFRNRGEAKKSPSIDVFTWGLKAYAAKLTAMDPNLRLDIQSVEIYPDNLTQVLDVGFRSFLYKKEFCGPADFNAMGLDMVTKRLVIVGHNGEVFENRVKPCGDTDIRFDRMLSRKSAGGCTTIHYLQGLQFNERRSPAYRIESLCQPLKQHHKKNKFALLATTRVIKRTHHPAHALVRSALFRLLVQQFPDEIVEGTKFIQYLSNLNYSRAHCEGNDLDIATCKSNYMFSVDMENTSTKGYVSEKIFSGLLAGTIPIYYGAPDIFKYINPDRIIHCDISPSRRDELESKKKRRDVFHFDDNNTNPSDEQLLLQSTAFLEEDLRPCLNEVVRVFNDKLLYDKKLNAPVFSAGICSSPYLSHDVGENIFNALPSIL